MNKKRLLFIAPDVFYFHKVITAGFEEMGWDVTYLGDRPPLSGIGKILVRKFRPVMAPFLNAYYAKKIQHLGKFDKVIIVKGEGITQTTLKLIRERTIQPITVYFWDGVKNIPGGLQLSRSVEKVFSFDPLDSKKYGFQLLPLFFVKPKADISRPAKWLVSFIGSVHSDRLAVISKFRDSLKDKSSIFIFIYFPSPLLFYFRKFFDRSFKDFRSDELSQQSIAKSVVEEVIAESQAVLDIHHPKQTGLTIRTLETLSLGKKLITTNATIKDYPFYDESCIYVMDRNSPAVPDSFFQKQFSASCLKELERYELKNWLDTLLS